MQQVNTPNKESLSPVGVTKGILRLSCTPKTQIIRVSLPENAALEDAWLTLHVNGQTVHSMSWPVLEGQRVKEVELNWSSLETPAAATRHWAVVVNLLRGRGGPVGFQTKLLYLSTRCWQARQGRSLPCKAITSDQRLVTSILSTPHETHDWKFSAAEASTDVVHVWTVRFCRKSVTSTSTSPNREVATVRWTSSTADTSPSKRQRDSGGMETGFVLSRESTQTYTTFVVFAQKGSGVEVTCRVSRRGQADLLPRYLITQRTLSIPERVPVPLPVTGGVTNSSPRRVALLVGVSTYRRASVNPLQYCDEDVTAWHEYLSARGYECLILGDEYSPYPCWDGVATVANMRRALRSMVRSATNDQDRLVIVVSGHGNGDGRGNSNLCLLADQDGKTDEEREGRYTDSAIKADLADYQGRAFVFLDACFSGGIIEELMSALPNAVGCTTCTERGYGYDSAQEQHGAWTNQFLCKGLSTLAKEGSRVDLIQLLLQSQREYIQRYRKSGDRPCFFAVDKKEKLAFQSDITTCAPPLGRFMVEDYI